MAAVALAAIFVGPASNLYWRLPPQIGDLLAYDKYDAGMRVGTCMLTSGYNDFALYRADECLRLKNDKKNILIVGESHAAHLWYGLQATFPEINFLQATSSGCKPVIDTTGERRCVELVEFIFNTFLSKNRIDGIILSANWEKSNISSAVRTAKFLERYADSVFIFGPIVNYRESLPRILARKLMMQSDQTSDEEFASRYRSSEQAEIDHAFREAAIDGKVRYVSVYKLLCEPECAVWATAGNPMQFDYGHLTKKGSQYLAQRLPRGIFETMP
jgi:hypothetical protein